MTGVQTCALPISWAAQREFPIIPCTLCGSQDGLQRAQIKAMIHQWERQSPGRIDNMFNAMAHVVPSHLMDRNLYPFATLQATGVADSAGDLAFDDAEGCQTPTPAEPSATVPIRAAL